MKIATETFGQGAGNVLWVLARSFIVYFAKIIVQFAVVLCMHCINMHSQGMLLFGMVVQGVKRQKGNAK